MVFAGIIRHWMQCSWCISVGSADCPNPAFRFGSVWVSPGGRGFITWVPVPVMLSVLILIFLCVDFRRATVEEIINRINVPSSKICE